MEMPLSITRLSVCQIKQSKLEEFRDRGYERRRQAPTKEQSHTKQLLSFDLW